MRPFEPNAILPSGERVQIVSDVWRLTPGSPALGTVATHRGTLMAYPAALIKPDRLGTPNVPPSPKRPILELP